MEQNYSTHGTSFSDYKYDVKEYFTKRYANKKISILDVGAGTGIYSYLLRDLTHKMDAVEIYTPNIEENNLNYLYDTVHNINIINYEFDYYDLIIMGDVLEHLSVENATKVIERMYDKCEEMLIAVPFRLEQDELYGNTYEKHLQPDLTDELFHQRYPGFKVLFMNDNYAYYIKVKEKNGERKNMVRRRLSIAFLDTIGTPYNGDTLKTRGMGGSESAIVYLSEELTKLDFEVTVFNRCDKEGNYGGIEYIDISNAHKNTKEFDVLITSRTVLPYAPIHHRETILNKYGYDIQPLKAIVDRSGHKVMWLHDTFILGEEWAEDVLVDRDYDEIFTLSDFHTNYIAKATHGNRPRFFEVLKDRIFQTRNGIKSFYDEVDIEAKDKDLFVYNASTTKGLVPLMRQIWPRVKKDIPTAKLVIIGGYYAGVAPKGQMDEIETVFRELQRDFEGKLGVTFTGIITQKEVADILVKASYFIYPGAFPETFGISATEALNYNVPLITTKFGALEEIAPEKTSYHINFSITRDMNLYDRVYSKGEPEQVEKFIELVKSVYNNEYIRKQKMYAANEYKPFLGWDTVALQWKHHLLHKLKLYMNREEMERVRYVTGRLNALYNRRFINEEDKIEDYSLDHKNKIVIVSPMYNISRYMATHILSVAAQLYDNYVHYIIDDMSDDNSMDIFKEVVGNLPEKIRDKYVIITNNEKKYALRNQVELISSLEDNPIILLLDGDDFLDNDPDIFNYINRQYLNGAKFTYGSCHSLADDIDLVAQPYPKKVLKDRSYRNYLFPWGMPYTHLRTFRKSVFDAADHSKFKDENGNYWRAGGDNALFYPLMDVCEPHEIRAIQKILVRYNDINPLNDYKVNAEEQNKAAAIIRDDNNRIVTAEEEFDFHLENARNTKDAKSVAYVKAVYKNNETISSITSFKSESSYIEIKLLEYIRDHFEGRDDRDLSLIDTTAGVGNFIADIKNMNIGFNIITAVDPVSSIFEIGRMVHPDFNWYNGNIEDDYLNGSYDLIILKDNLTKLADPESVIDRLINDNLNPGGLIVYSVLSEEHAFTNPFNFNITIINEGIETISDKFEVVEINTEKWYTGAIMSKKPNKKNNKTAGIVIKDLEMIDNIRNGLSSKDEQETLKSSLKNRGKDTVWIDEINDDPYKRTRLDYLKSNLSAYSKDIKILDIGAWTGAFANEVYNFGYKNITCMDISHEVVELGKKTFPHMNWIESDIEHAIIEEKYDVIFMGEVLEHLVDPLKVLKSLKKNNLNENGRIVFTLPHEDDVFRKDFHEHVSMITGDSLSKIADDLTVISLPDLKTYAGTILKNKSNKTGKILIAIPTAKNIETDTFKSIYRLIKPQGFQVDFECFYGYNIDQVRNLMAHYTIHNKYDYIYFVDSDMILPEDSLIKLLSHNQGIVSGLYIQRRLEAKIPEMYKRRPNGSVTNLSMDELEDNTLMEIESCGFGGVLIKREVLEKVGYPYFLYKHSIDFRDTVSEDVYFCLKAEGKGYKTYLDTSLKYNHISRIDLVPVK